MDGEEGRVHLARRPGWRGWEKGNELMFARKRAVCFHAMSMSASGLVCVSRTQAQRTQAQRPQAKNLSAAYPRLGTEGLCQREFVLASHATLGGNRDDCQLLKEPLSAPLHEHSHRHSETHFAAL